MSKNNFNDKNFIIGRLSMNARGFGFVTPEIQESEEDTDIFIHAGKMATALHGDRVRIKITPPRNYYEAHIRGKREGEIIQVIERVNKQIIGTYKVINFNHVVVADDVRLPQMIKVQNHKDFSELKPGMKVVLEITSYSTPLSGIITEILGKEREPGVDILAIIRRYGVTPEFPKEVLDVAAKIETTPSKDEIASRIGRRKLKIVTIDGADAKDLDDGVYAKQYADGSYFLGVYIADVSYYVEENSPLDVEAFERGTSIYPVDRVVPMLPTELSNGICSLNAGVDRLAMACEMVLDQTGKVKYYEIFPTTIHVYKRLTYTAVNKFFEGDKSQVKNLKEIAPMLETLKKICELRKKIRFDRGAIDFDQTEIKIKLDDKGRPIDLIKRERNLAESIIEECMLVANESVAKYMFDLKKPFIYRVHGQPESEKIDKFNLLLANFGLHINKHSDDSIKPVDIQKILEQVKGKREETIINTIALRSMQQARYSAEQGDHFGLAAEFYTHFTSPIRRYPDLIVHRLLHELFDDDPKKSLPRNARKKFNKKRNANLKQLLPHIAKQSSDRERRAVDIEREATDLKAVEYMKKFVGKYFNGVIVSVTRFGFFVEIDKGVDGLVRITSLVDDDYNFVEDQYALIGEFKGKSFKIGDEVRVKLVEANVALRQLTFILVDKKLEPENIIV
ncbi:MAG: ribonuclease R [Selenomonadaceae bacterium]|nr:ribonuclease R [Selenomonadaceae bacterium]